MPPTSPNAMNASRLSTMSFLLRWSGPVILTLLVLGAILWFPYVAGYADHRLTLRIWIQGGWSNPSWQHGALAVPICAFLAWRKRRTLAALPIQPNAWGLVICIFAMLFYWVGYRGNFYYLGFVALHLFLIGSIIWLWSGRHFKEVSFAVLMLVFAWPFLFLEDFIAFKLRFLMVTLTQKFLNVVGIATIQEGTRIFSAATETLAQGERFRMNIDGPCSGLRSLFALMMVSALFGYFRQRSLWRRCLLFSLSVPLAVFANGLRIIVLTFATMWFGERFALGNGEEYTSNFHLLTGLFMFVVALGGLSLAESLLNRIFRRQTPLHLTEDR